MEYPVDKFYEYAVGPNKSNFVYFIKNAEGQSFVLTGVKTRIADIPVEVHSSEGISTEFFFEQFKT